MFGKDTDSEFDGEDSSDAAGEDLEQNDMVTVQVEESEKDENAEAELKEIKPEDVANGKVGIVQEDRKRVEEELLSKKVFKDDKTTKEAREIIGNL